MANRPALHHVQSIVIKIGSGVLVRDGTRFDRGTFCRIVEIVAGLVESGRQVAIVSSGAVALGRGRMGQEKPDRQRSLPKLQALAAIGQSILMQHYENELAHYNLCCGQILLTRQDTDNRTRYLNARRTLRTLWDLGAVPIINENDTITTDEIRLGDNDNLAARVATLLQVDLLAIYSDVDAIFEQNPKLNPDARPIDTIDAHAPHLDHVASDTATSVGTGGMLTKIEAARIAAKRGIPTLITSGKDPNALLRALKGSRDGTLLLPSNSPHSSRKAWIAALKAQGRLICDPGAVGAVRDQGRSLLPSGVTDVQGKFDEGEALELCTADGQVFAHGLAAYPASDMRRIAGVQSSNIESILGYHASDALIHRDDLVLSEPHKPT